MNVAPYTGAWIEITLAGIAKELSVVAPYTGAWIEIRGGFSSIGFIKSLPTRERGLKSARQAKAVDSPWSLPTRERGLKSVVGLAVLAL